VVAPPRPPSRAHDRAVWAGEMGAVAHTRASHHPPLGLISPAPELVADLGRALFESFFVKRFRRAPGVPPLASGARQARCGRGRLGASELGGRAGELFGAASGGVRGR